MNKNYCNYVTDSQLKQKESEYRYWLNFFAKIRTKILSESFPKAIILTNDGNIKYKYSESIENTLKEIDKMEEIQLKTFIICG